MKSVGTPIVRKKVCAIYPCVLANDGTSLKSAIEFDPHLKENVGLTFNIELSYIKSNHCPSPKSGKTAEFIYKVSADQITTLQTPRLTKKYHILKSI